MSEESSISVLSPDLLGAEYFDRGVFTVMTDMVARQLVALPDENDVPQNLVLGATSNLVLQSKYNMKVDLEPNAGVDFYHATGYYNESLTEDKFLSLNATSNVTSLSAPNAIAIVPGDNSTTTKIGSMYVTENSTTQLLNTQKLDFTVMKDITVNGNFNTTGQFFSPYLNAVNLIIDQNLNVNNQVTNGNMYGNNLNIWINKGGSNDRDTNRIGYGFYINSNTEQLELFKYKRYSYVDSNGISHREGKTQYRKVAQFGYGVTSYDKDSDIHDTVVFETLDAISGPSNLGLTGGVQSSPGNAVWAMNSNCNLYFYGSIGINQTNPQHQVDVIGTICASDTVISNNYATASDKRIKTDITRLNNAVCLDSIMKMDPVSYNLTTDNKRHVGFIAQEMRAIIPESVDVKSNTNLNIEDFHYMDYNSVISYLVASVQELERRLGVLEGRS